MSQAGHQPVCSIPVIANMLSLLYSGHSFCSLHHCKRYVPLIMTKSISPLGLPYLSLPVSCPFQMRDLLQYHDSCGIPIPIISVIPWLDTSLYEQPFDDLSVNVHYRSHASLFGRYSCCAYYILVSFFAAYSRSNTFGIADRQPPCLQPLFHSFAPSFSELSHFKATYFYHANLA